MLPQANSTVIETGSTEVSWMTASESWLMLGEVAMATMGIVGTQMFASIASMNGIRSMTHEMLTPPFLLWLASMAAIAFKQALVTEIVAMSYGQTRATMIPTVVSNQNRIDEAITEATNVFGQNSGLIAYLNGEYAEYTVQNASLGMTYGDVITGMTLPTPIPPPPPLGNLLGTAGQAAGSLGDAASQLGQVGQGVSQEAAQVASQVAGNGSSAMGGMDQFASLAQAPAQIAGQLPQAVSAPGQLVGQLAGQLGNFTNMFNGGSTGNAFAPALASHNGGLPLGSHFGSGTGAGVGTGGGSGSMGGAGTLSAASRGGGGGNLSRSAVLTGITSPTDTQAAPNSTGGRGGMAPPIGIHPNQGETRKKREHTVLTAANSGDTGGNREARGSDRELFS
jgi:PPE-repeat protein